MTKVLSYSRYKSTVWLSINLYCKCVADWLSKERWWRQLNNSMWTNLKKTDQMQIKIENKNIWSVWTIHENKRSVRIDLNVFCSENWPWSFQKTEHYWKKWIKKWKKVEKVDFSPEKWKKSGKVEKVKKVEKVDNLTPCKKWPIFQISQIPFKFA